MASSFEEEILEWALDQDSIQNLLRVASEKWSISRSDALSKIVRMAECNLIVIYQDLEDGLGTEDIDPKSISENFVNERHYTWVGPTSQTIEHLNRMR